VFTVPFDHWVNFVQWSPDGTALATIADDGIVRILDATTGDLLAAAAGHDASGNVVEWSRDGETLATGAYDGVAKIWDFDGRLLVERQRIQHQDLTNGVSGLAFSPEGNRLAVADYDITSTKIVDITDQGSAEIVGVEAEPWLGVELRGDDFLRTSADGLLEAIDLTTGDTDQRFGSEPLDWPGAVFAHDGDEVAIVVGGGRAIQVRSMETGELMAQHAVLEGRGVEALALSPDGQHLAYAKMIDDFTTALILVIDRNGTVEARMEMDGIFTRSISFSADGVQLAITKFNQLRQDPERDGIRVWDWAADEVVGEISLRPQLVDFDPTGRFLGATVGNDSRAEIFDAITLEPVATLAGSTTPLLPITFSPDGSMVATGGNDGMVRIWDPVTGAERSVLPTPATVRRLDFDETGDRLVSTDDTNTARVWALDLDTLIEIAEQRVTRDLTPAECERYLQASCPV
jgi:WD40 repeat protein